jgi:hypothetical protein
MCATHTTGVLQVLISMTPSLRIRNRSPVSKVMRGIADETGLPNVAARVFHRHLLPASQKSRLPTVESVAHLLKEVAHETLNPQRALLFAARAAASLDKSEGQIELSENSLAGLMRLCGSSEFFGETLAVIRLSSVSWETKKFGGGRETIDFSFEQGSKSRKASPVRCRR